MKIAFLWIRLEDIDPVWETTSHLMYESNQRGHTVYFLEPHDLYIRENIVMARMHDISIDAGSLHTESIGGQRSGALRRG